MMHLHSAALLIFMLASLGVSMLRRFRWAAPTARCPGSNLAPTITSSTQTRHRATADASRFNGGSATVVYNITPTWSGVADLTLGHANNVNNTGQNITIFNYLFGPSTLVACRAAMSPMGKCCLAERRRM